MTFYTRWGSKTGRSFSPPSVRKSKIVSVLNFDPKGFKKGVPRDPGPKDPPSTMIGLKVFGGWVVVVGGLESDFSVLVWSKTIVLFF